MKRSFVSLLSIAILEALSTAEHEPMRDEQTAH
jgi:hypothetical protein